VPVTLDGQRLTGLLKVSSLSVPASELGGPLFNLSRQVLGLIVGYGTRGGVGDGYVVPIDSALRLARQIPGQLCNSHPTARKIHQIKNFGSC
jgi:hypothetical protein